jgi:uncharacterized metal-binding protein YceD (DUF177 family)
MDLMTNYDIYFVGKKEGIHQFSYEVGESFFQMFEDSSMGDAHLSVAVEMEKKPNLLSFSFEIKGQVELVCDRCLDSFRHPIEVVDMMYVKLADKEEEIDEHMISVSRNAEKVNLAKWIYETIVLQVPIRKVHPDDENGNPSCNSEMLEKLYIFEHNNSKESDSRWDKLRELYNK